MPVRLPNNLDRCRSGRLAAAAKARSTGDGLSDGARVVTRSSLRQNGLPGESSIVALQGMGFLLRGERAAGQLEGFSTTTAARMRLLRDSAPNALLATRPSRTNSIVYRAASQTRIRQHRYEERISFTARFSRAKTKTGNSRCCASNSAKMSSRSEDAPEHETEFYCRSKRKLHRNVPTRAKHPVDDRQPTTQPHRSPIKDVICGVPRRRKRKLRELLRRSEPTPFSGNTGPCLDCHQKPQRGEPATITPGHRLSGLNPFQRRHPFRAQLEIYRCSSSSSSSWPGCSSSEFPK